MNILLLSNVSHADTPTSQLHLARALSSSHRIVYVDTLGNRAAGGAGRRDASKLLRRLARGLTGPRRLQSDLVALSPLAVPGPSGHGAARLDNLLLVPQLLRTMRAAGFTRPDVLWVASPSGVRIADLMPDVPILYYCTDDTSAFPGVRAERVLADEARLLQRASVAIAVSEPLARSLSLRGARDVHVVENGVDASLFACPPQPALERADALLADICRPVVLFAGVIDERTDVDLLGSVASSMPHLSFVIAGPLMATFAGTIPALANVHHLGAVPHAVVAALASRADACIAPYADTHVVRTSSPLKVLEYLAAGKPVVATDVAPLRALASVVSLAGDAASFAEALADAVDGESRSSAQVGRAVASARDWPAVAARVDAILRSVHEQGGERCVPSQTSSSCTTT